ncbi:metalloreductase STEAP4-like [Lingula anatina]|uniref:Metalloreductase STEAP4-like n=1 Tax=Lingula anatina TaxID=7574 RepID=A0A1S3IER6_LINAN|nr:metalloreductase STEAP4-like [Lingula anatina]|eukprot:XP_013395954.1 metalloreductase STEAP4-like [Lingula anatina]
MTLELFPGWGFPLLFSFFVLVVSTLSLLLKFYWVPSTPKYNYNQFASMMLMLAFGFAALQLLACVYLPAPLAAILQLVNGTKHKEFPRWFDGWMKARKHLGIITLAFSVIHTVLALPQYDLAYLSDYYYEVEMVNVVRHANASDFVTASIPIAGKMNWKGETMLLAGTIALILMAVVGIATLPSVQQTLSWREWTCIQSYVGVVCFLTSIAHVVCMGGEYWQETAFYETNSWNVLLFPFVVVLLRILCLLPCISIPVTKIRRGWERKTTNSQAKIV